MHITRLSVPRVYVLDNYHRQRHQHHQYYAPGQVSARDDPDIPFDPAEPLLRAPDPAEHLVLDCEYVIEPHETGFVLKWLHNDVPIYQWIPPHRSPSSLNRMRDHVNRTFTVGNEAMHKHRALALMHPSQDFAGKYSCSVHTYQSFDIKSADLFIIGKVTSGLRPAAQPAWVSDNLSIKRVCRSLSCWFLQCPSPGLC